MKKIPVFILFSLTIVLTTGGYFFHRVHLISYKKEFKLFIQQNKNTIETTQLIIEPSELFINTSKITWVDDNKEIYYKGKLYDIVTITRKKDSVVIDALSDSKEQKLKEEFAYSYNNDAVGKANNKPIKLLKQFLTLKYLGTDLVEFQFLQSSNTLCFCINYNACISKVFLNKETPPPNFS